MATTVQQAVAAKSGTRPQDWTYIDGPSSGVGVEYWLRHPSGLEAYVCVDQGDTTVSIGEPGGLAMTEPG